MRFPFNLQYYFETVGDEQVLVRSDVGLTAYVLMVLSEATQLTGASKNKILK